MKHHPLETPTQCGCGARGTLADVLRIHHVPGPIKTAGLCHIDQRAPQGRY